MRTALALRRDDVWTRRVTRMIGVSTAVHLGLFAAVALLGAWLATRRPDSIVASPFARRSEGRRILFTIFTRVAAAQTCQKRVMSIGLCIGETRTQHTGFTVAADSAHTSSHEGETRPSRAARAAGRAPGRARDADR